MYIIALTAKFVHILFLSISCLYFYIIVVTTNAHMTAFFMFLTLLAWGLIFESLLR